MRTRAPAAGRQPTAGVTGSSGLPFARIAGGPGLPAPVVERLACAGRVRLAVRGRDGGAGRFGGHSDVLDLGRSHRLVSPRQLLALKLRDGDACAHPGCHRRAGLQAHHVRHWLYGGRTDLDNLLLLCTAHHRAHHEGEFTIHPLGAGRFAFYRNHRHLPAWADPTPVIAAPTPIEDEHDAVAADAAASRWDGTRLDRHWAVAALAQHLSRAAVA